MEGTVQVICEELDDLIGDHVYAETVSRHRWYHEVEYVVPHPVHGMVRFTRLDDPTDHESGIERCERYGARSMKDPVTVELVEEYRRVVTGWKRRSTVADDEVVTTP